jgi:hypothetical protein
MEDGAMDHLLHPAAPHDLPSFNTAPGETDVLMVVMGLILALAVVMFGLFFLRRHTLPERMAHKSKKIQFEIVAVLGLIALFTHMHIFWVAGLLLAMIDLPDFGTSLGRIATSTEKIAGIEPAETTASLQPDIAGMNQANGALDDKHVARKEPEDGVRPIKPSPPGRTRKKEPSHA